MSRLDKSRGKDLRRTFLDIIMDVLRGASDPISVSQAMSSEVANLYYQRAKEILVHLEKHGLVEQSELHGKRLYRTSEKGKHALLLYEKMLDVMNR